MEQKAGLIGMANPDSVRLEGTPWEAENEFFEPACDSDSLHPRK